MKTPFSLTAIPFRASVSTGDSTSLLGLLWRLWPLLLPVCLLLPALGSFPFPSPEAAYSDLAISHYPNAVYLRQALLTYRSPPLWSPTILSGYPFAANPLSGLWYPGGWLALVLPLPLGFNLLVVLHLLWGGLGFYLFLRALGMKTPAALLGALAFESMPKVFAHYGAGHITLIYALTWTPWLLLVTEWGFRAWDRSRFWRAPARVLPAVILATILLADMRWGAYAALLWWGYAFWRRGKSGQAELVGDLETVQTVSPDRHLWHLLLLTAVALMLAAPLLLPLIEYTALSTRSSLGAQDVLVYSLPPLRLLGLFFPDLGGFHEWIIYPGWVVLLLASLSVLWGRTRKLSVFWILVAVLSLVFAMGENLPLLPLLARLPIFNLLRVPPRALFLFGMALAVLAGYGLETLSAGVLPAEHRRANLLFVFLLAFCAALTLMTSWVSGELQSNYIWGLAALVAAAGWMWLSMVGSVSPAWSLVGLFVLCLVDLGAVNYSLFSPRPVDSVLSQAAQVVDYLTKRPGTFRVYSPSYSLPQQSAVRGSLSLADGVDPLQLSSYAGFMELASGVPASGYSVTLPPFENGDPSTANAAYIPRADLLGMLNVRYVAAEYAINAPGLSLADHLGSTYIYENTAYRPPAWVQPIEGQPEGYTSVDTYSWEPNRIEVQASGPGTLVLSEINYPGWQVWVDGERQELQSEVSILRAVNLPPGEHIVSFQFRPLSLYLGMGLTVLGMLLVLIIGYRPVKVSDDG